MKGTRLNAFVQISEELGYTVAVTSSTLDRPRSKKAKKTTTQLEPLKSKKETGSIQTGERSTPEFIIAVILYSTVTYY